MKTSALCGPIGAQRADSWDGGADGRDLVGRKFSTYKYLLHVIHSTYKTKYKNKNKA